MEEVLRQILLEKFCYMQPVLFNLLHMVKMIDLGKSSYDASFCFAFYVKFFSGK